MKLFFQIITLSACMSFFAAAETIKNVATVDMKELFEKYKETKTIKDRVSKNQAVILQDNKTRVAEIQKVVQVIDKKRKQLNDATLNETQKKKILLELKSLQQKGNALETGRRDWYERRMKAINEDIGSEMKKVLKQINEKVADYAKANNIDMILDKSGSSNAGTKFLLFSKNSFDITEKLLLTLNK